MGLDEGLDRHRHRPGDSFDDIIRSCEQSLLKVECDGAKMLDCLLGQAELLQLTLKFRDFDRLVDDLAAERGADRFRDAILIHFHRTKELIGLAGMRSRIR